jgi:DNA (cytosine-5)-methyltransferase 1
VTVRLLDLFCGAGGAAMGYHRAGFDVVGVDIAPQPHYPFEFHQGDAMTWPLDGFDAIHASPPCQAYSTATRDPGRHPDLYELTRARLTRAGVPWVIENVMGAPYRQGVILCGSMFGLRVRRHRCFESSQLLMPPCGCRHAEQGVPLGVYGHGGGGKSTRPSGGGGTKAKPRDFGALMQMEWATRQEIVLAVPPAYTEHIGAQLLDHLRAVA